MESKVAVVTGAASGIGLQSAKVLASHGAQVILLDINDKKSEDAVLGIKNNGGRASYYNCDVSSKEDCQKTVKLIEKEFGKIDILFNNAGVIKRKNVVDLKEDEWDIVLNVSLKGVYLLSKYAIPIMAKNGGGSIINTGSGWGIKGGDNAAAYCAAKGGVVNLTKAMAIDHGYQNIRVNSINPGDTDTELLREEGRQLGIDEKRFLDEAYLGRPLERLGTPQDIADAVLFLASDLSKWITGTAIIVDGGGLA